MYPLVEKLLQAAKSAYALIPSARKETIPWAAPYVPKPRTTLREALQLLRQHRFLYIQEGCLYYGGGGLHVRMRGKQDFPEISPQEALALLKANYPLPLGAERRKLYHLEPEEVDDRDTDPTGLPNITRVEEGIFPPPVPVPLHGEGYYAEGDTLEDIASFQWEPCIFSQWVEDADFVGERMLNDQPTYVWYSHIYSCFLAQHIPCQIEVSNEG
jgi:hypothetical protein